MLKIRAKQMKRLDAEARTVFTKAAAIALRKRRPDETAALTPQEFDSYVAEGVDHALGLGITDDKTALNFLEIGLPPAVKSGDLTIQRFLTSVLTNEQSPVKLRVKFLHDQLAKRKA